MVSCRVSYHMALSLMPRITKCGWSPFLSANQTINHGDVKDLLQRVAVGGKREPGEEV